MKFGASTACYYPLYTETALEHILDLGFRNTEIFFNTDSELEPAYLKQLGAMAREHGANVCALHPFTSFLETNCLFSLYHRRFTDTLEYYKRYFEAAHLLNAPMVVIHGSKLPGLISHEEYFERFGRLAQAGRQEGVLVAQENVNAFFSQDISFLNAMRSALGDLFHLVFDIKQAVRAGYEPLTFAKAFAKEICHIHISDHDDRSDCLPPGKGVFDFRALVSLMESFSYGGAYMIEIYRKNYDVNRELFQAKAYLESII